MSNDGVWVVIPASGVGSRMQSTIPKQYLSVQGKTVLEHTVGRFFDIPEVVGIIVVVSELDSYWSAVKNNLASNFKNKTARLYSTQGGSERSESVLNGLAFLSDVLSVKSEQWVMVHDAARPCVNVMDVMTLLKEVRSNPDADGGILATPVKDTLKRARADGIVLETQARESLWQALTPQLFQLGALVESIQIAMKAGIAITDEASAMEFNHKQVQLVEGSSDNIKLTTPSDLKIIDFLLKDNKRNNGF